MLWKIYNFLDRYKFMIGAVLIFTASFLYILRGKKIVRNEKNIQLFKGVEKSERK